MILTLHIDFIKDGGEATKQLSVRRHLPNKDAYHLFESWMHLKECKEIPSRIIDGVMDMIYDIVSDEAKIVLGLTDKGYADGNWDIEDPMVHNEEEMSAIIFVDV